MKMNRQLLRGLFGLLIAAVAPLLNAQELQKGPQQEAQTGAPKEIKHPLPEKPNIVIFLVDDSGWGDYQHNGNPMIATPNITRMARKGTSFTQFYVSTAACSASRYALLTGRYPGRSGLGKWVIGPRSPRYLHPREITLADALKDRGYVTAMFGKWHLGTPNRANQMSPDALPLAHGFDQWIGTNVSHDYSNAMLLQSNPKGHDPIQGYSTLAKNLPSDVAASESLVGRYTDAAVAFIKANKDKPFFAYIAHNQPHLALFASDAFKGKSRHGLLGDVMAEIDDSVGQVLKTLEEEGIAHKTLVIYTSDNGPWVVFRNRKKTKYGDTRLQVGYAWPFRDGKGSTWEGGHRVPGIFYWPGVIPAGNVERNPASTLDIFPTLMKLTGGKIPQDRTLDGRNIMPYLMGTNQPVEPFEFLYSYQDNRPSAIRIGPWKLHIRIGSQTGNNYGFKASREKPLLFQVEHDISERIDVAAEHPDRVRAMLERLEEKEKQIDSEGSFWRVPLQKAHQ